jgi:SAM-dependent methyltransferase
MHSTQQWFETWFDSPYYHILYESRDESEAQFFIDRLIQHFQIPPRAQVLDLACGKGRHSVYLAKNNLEVTGLDLSELNISIAKNFEHPGLHFLVHDMREVYRLNAFDFIFNFFTSFGYFDNPEDNQRTMDAAARQLKRGGTLVIDFMNTRKVLAQMIFNEVRRIDVIEFLIKRRFDGRHVIKRIAIDDEGKQLHFEERVQALRLPDFEQLLENSALKLKEVYGDYHLNSFSERDSDRLILFAEKR